MKKENEEKYLEQMELNMMLGNVSGNLWEIARALEHIGNQLEKIADEGLTINKG